MVSGGGGGGATGEDSNKDISLSHHGFNFLGNSFGKNLNFYGTQDKMKWQWNSKMCLYFFQDGEPEDLNNKNSRGNGGSGIFVNVPLLAQS